MLLTAQDCNFGDMPSISRTAHNDGPAVIAGSVLVVEKEGIYTVIWMVHNEVSSMSRRSGLAVDQRRMLVGIASRLAACHLATEMSVRFADCYAFRRRVRSKKNARWKRGSKKQKEYQV